MGGTKVTVAFPTTTFQRFTTIQRIKKKEIKKVSTQTQELYIATRFIINKKGLPTHPPIHNAAPAQLTKREKKKKKKQKPVIKPSNQ
jgi:hypothetical protein